MKRRIALLLAAMFLLITCAACVPAFAEGGLSMKVRVKFDENAYFSKYDVEMYLDGNYVSTLVHGRKAEVPVNGVAPGRHEIVFYSTKTRSATGSLSFTISRDAIVECRIHAYNDHVGVGEMQMFGLVDSAEREAASGGKSVFSYDISFPANMYFSKYDVELFVDDQSVATFVQGKRTSGSFTIDNGAHTLTFYRVGAHSVFGSLRLIVVEDVSFRAELGAYNNEVVISDVATNAGI